MAFSDSANEVFSQYVQHINAIQTAREIKWLDLATCTNNLNVVLRDIQHDKEGDKAGILN